MMNHLNRYIDHTLLDPAAVPVQISTLCTEARRSGFFAVCVNPCYVRQACRDLCGSPVAVATVVGFPLGATLTRIKAAETRAAITCGADEIDMMINIGAIKANLIDLAVADIAAVVKAARGRLVKVIIECDLLTDEEKVRAAQACVAGGANMVKTSSGFAKNGKGATVDDVLLIKKTIQGSNLGIKASAGIRDYETAEALIKAGATRLGTSAGVTICTHRAD
jgi:deoxyribose-phosphate aldolase